MTGFLDLREHLHDAFVGGGCAHGGVDDEQDGVGEFHGHLGLLRHAGVDAAGIVLPAAGVHHREVAAVPVRRVHDAVAGDAGGVLHHGLAAAQDPVDQGGLAHVGPADDGQDRVQLDRTVEVLVVEVAAQQGGVVFVQLVVVQAGPEGGRAELRLVVVQGGKVFSHLVGAGGRVFVFAGAKIAGGLSRIAHCTFLRW